MLLNLSNQLLDRNLANTLFLYINLFTYLFVYVFLAALGLRCCTRAFSSCGEWRLLFVAVRGFLWWWLLLLQSAGFRHAGFSSCGMQAQQLWLVGSRVQAQQLWHTGLVAHGMWDLLGRGLEPMSPALAGGFLTTAPPGKPGKYS